MINSSIIIKLSNIIFKYLVVNLVTLKFQRFLYDCFLLKNIIINEFIFHFNFN